MGSCNLPLSFIGLFSLSKDVWATHRWFESEELRDREREKKKPRQEMRGEGKWITQRRMNLQNPKAKKHFLRRAAGTGTLMKQDGFKCKPHVSLQAAISGSTTWQRAWMEGDIKGTTYCKPAKLWLHYVVVRVRVVLFCVSMRPTKRWVISGHMCQ